MADDFIEDLKKEVPSEKSNAEEILEEMGVAGFKSALIRKDGQLYKSNFHFDEHTASILSSLLNVSDALIQQTKTESREHELSLEDSLLIAVPVSDYYLVSYIDDRSKKKTIREYAERIKKAI